MWMGIPTTTLHADCRGLTRPGSNGVARVSGKVADIDNPNAILNIQIVYDRVSGADWGGGFKHDMSCVPTSDITDAWTIYILNSGLSYFLGEETSMEPC